MMRRIIMSLFVMSAFGTHLNAAPNSDQHSESIPSQSLQKFDVNPTFVKQVIHLGLKLANDNLPYQYGSADPKTGGMDCSGTVYYILTTLGLKDVPRSSHLQYQWVEERGHFYSVDNQTNESVALAHLHPGDLLFWKGTYVVEHDPNVTHVMIYIGKNQAGQRLMVGSSNGRTYKGRKIDGVSVFDFKYPDTESHGKFLGYGCIPSVTCKL